MFKELIIFNVFIVLVISDCPYVVNNDVNPCVCLNNQIRCEGKLVNDSNIKTIFEKLSKSRPNYLKAFEGLELYDTNITFINSAVFSDIIFRGFVKINRNPITNLSLGNFPDLILLDVSGNRLTNLSSNTFLGLKSLRYLSVGDNQIERFPKEAFAVLDNLERLDLSGNKINKLVYDVFSAEYDNNIELSEVNLSFNNLTTLPDNIFWPLRRPALINLAHNNINAFGSNVFSFNEDVWQYDPIRIVLSDNKIKSEHFRNDTFIHVERQQLTIILDLTYNNITFLNQSLFAPIVNANPSSVIDVSHNPVKCGDCAHKWIVNDPLLRSKNSIVINNCADDVNRNIWQFNVTEYNKC